MDGFVLYCGFCLVVRKDDLKRAVTICNGQACCFDHLYYVQGGEYNRILEIIKKDELKEIKQKTEQALNKTLEVNEALKKDRKRLSRVMRGL